jgi:hypothetical protein
MLLDRKQVRESITKIVGENASDRDVYDKASKKPRSKIYSANLYDTGLDTLDVDNVILYTGREYGLDISVDINNGTLTINKLVNYVMKDAKAKMSRTRR